MDDQLITEPDLLIPLRAPGTVPDTLTHSLTHSLFDHTHISPATPAAVTSAASVVVVTLSPAVVTTAISSAVACLFCAPTEHCRLHHRTYIPGIHSVLRHNL